MIKWLGIRGAVLPRWRNVKIKSKKESFDSPVVSIAAESAVTSGKPMPHRLALGAVFAVAVLFIGLFLYVSLSRIRYPFDLEWLEGSMVVNVQRVLAGKGLYVEPSQEFACYQQQPVYYWVSALFSLPLGAGYFPLRLVSVLSAIGTLVLLFLIVRRETKSAVYGVVAAGVYAAGYGCMSEWYDIARVDSLCVFWLTAGLYAVRRPKPAAWNSALAAVLFLLAVFTKHPAVFVFAGAAAYLTLVNWRQGAVMAGIFTVGAGAAVLCMDRATGGWYTFYTFKLLQDISGLKSNFLGFWQHSMLLVVPVWCLAALCFVCAELSLWRDRRHLFFPLIMGSAFAGCWIARLQPGSVLNVDMPAYAAMAMTLPPALQALSDRLLKSPARFLRVLAVVVTLAVAAQFTAILYNPGTKIPTKADEAAGWKLIDYLRSFQGDIFIPFNTYYASMAGKKTFAHAMPTTDILQGNDGRLKKKLRDELFDALSKKKYAAIILPANDFGFAAAAAKFKYREIPFRIFENDTVFQPVIPNVACRPSRVFVPQSPPAGLGLLRDPSSQ